MYCSGNYHSFKLKFNIQRQKTSWWWVSMGSTQSGYTSGPYLSLSLTTDCASGSHTYRSVSEGTVREYNNGYWKHSTLWAHSSTRTTYCY